VQPFKINPNHPCVIIPGKLKTESEKLKMRSLEPHGNIKHEIYNICGAQETKNAISPRKNNHEAHKAHEENN
jgi:hypothetical protein